MSTKFGCSSELSDSNSADEADESAVTVYFQPSGHRLSVNKGETVLEAAHRQGFRLAHACRNGVCHICQADLLHGVLSVEDHSHVKSCNAVSGNRLMQSAKEQTVLLCKARPLIECEFEFKRIRGPKELDTKNHVLQIASVENLSEHIFQVNLLAAAGTIPEYFAGQYLQLLIPDQDAAFFSIANAPGKREIQLHIEVQQEHSNAIAVLRYLQKNTVVKVRLPLGSCYIADLPKAEVLLISAGTGFSQIKSIAEFLINQQFTGAVTVYWGVRHEQEMYGRDLVEQWVTQYTKWRFVPIYADNPDNEWPGHHDELVKAVLSGGHQWDSALAYVSGSPAMVYTALDALLPAGLSETRYFSDVLEYAPR
jgi:CDP-4-dehydro-6-deoxyglucose reductase, E3